MLSVIATPSDPQLLDCLPACFLPSTIFITTVPGMSPQDAVDIEPASPFGGGIRVPLAFVVLRILLVSYPAFRFIALAVLVDKLAVDGHVLN